MATSEGRGRLRAPSPLGEPYGFMLLQQVQEDRKTTQSAVEGWGVVGVIHTEEMCATVETGRQFACAFLGL